MILPGLISVAFYRRRPTWFQVASSLAFTVALSGLLGYWQDAGTPQVWTNVIIAIVGGVTLYGAILAFFVYWYLPSRRRSPEVPRAPAPPAQ
ncbi:MAG TPA: hypothetical protein VFF67_03615 [Thermoplasmata archaeon]|nr:hypothetical protein [Thermoplasmata archaeon]